MMTTTFETIDKMNTNFSSLTDQELMTTEGGLALETAAILTIIKWTAAGAGTVFAGGVFVGYTDGKKP